MKLNEAIHNAAEKLAGAGVPTPRLDAELLLSHLLHEGRAWIFTHVRDEFDDQNQRLFEALIDRRAGREPLQYIIGKQEFWGLAFKVTPDVLIPRPETELVVEAAISILKNNPHPTLIDLCTGSGCIAVSLAKEFSSSRIFATDMSDRALMVARYNAHSHETAERIHFLEGDLFQPLEEFHLQDRVDLITANPPYIPASDLPSLQPEVRDFEPEMALICGHDGTEIHGRIINTAPEFLNKHGALIMEMGMGQAKKLISTIKTAGDYKNPEILKDLAGIERVIIARKK